MPTGLAIVLSFGAWLAVMVKCAPAGARLPGVRPTEKPPTPTGDNMRAVILTALLLLPAVTLATGKSPPKDPPKPAPAPVAIAGAAAGADAAAQASADAAADASSTSGAEANNALSLSSTYRERRQAPALATPSIYASGSCGAGWSAGVSVPGAAVSGGKSRPDTSCDRRELVRVVAPLNPFLALKVACEDPLIVDMLLRGLVEREQCEYVPPAPVAAVMVGNSPPESAATAKPAPASTSTAPRYVTEEQLREMERRIISRLGK